MSESTPAVAPVRVSVTVEVSREHAFAVFTDRFDTWWPRSHHTGTTELAEVRLEPRQGGRWYEIDTDGVEGNWGTVLAWDPPSRLVLGWQLDTAFRYNPDFVTEVEVTFTAEGPHRTHVLLEHRNLERYGERAEEMRASFDSDGGWNGILAGFAEVAHSVADPTTRRSEPVMSIRTTPWPAGVPCWTDLSVPDVDAAKAFYGAVLGWTFGADDPDFGGYVLAGIDGVPAAGIGPLQPGAPVAWTLYFAADDADKAAASVTENGGTLLMPPGDVGEFGRMFLAADPTGAAFGVWQAGVHIGAGIKAQAGGLSWEDLRSSDPDTARAFYTAVFGFDTQPLPMAGPDYTTFSLSNEAETPLGGIGSMMGEDGAAPYWLIYFGVADTDASVAAATARGGSVTQPVFDSPFGKMAGLTDPDGATFWVVQAAG